MAQSLQPGWRNKGGYDPPPAMKDGGGSDQPYCKPTGQDWVR